MRHCGVTGQMMRCRDKEMGPVQLRGEIDLVTYKLLLRV